MSLSRPITRLALRAAPVFLLYTAAGVAIAVLTRPAVALAQPATQVLVRGSVVVGETSEPVPAANVVVSGTQIGTQTNDRGEFSLRVPRGTDTLVVSRIGYAPARVPLAGQTLVTVRLTRTAVALSEVVVVGYGTQKRSDITGSVTSVSQQRLEEKPNTNVVAALEGSLPGVSVAATRGGAEPGLNIQVRGRNSISASTDPLVVIDGIPYNGALSEINPSDIQSLEVLKDASAKAIYGARGSNGVILITSKKGVVGKPRFTYNGYAGTQNAVNIPNLMTAPQFADFKCVRLRTATTTSCSQTLTPTEIRNLAAGVDVNWVDVATRTGHQQQHDLSFSGGSEDTRYFVGGTVLDVTGIARGDNFNRASARVNLDQRLSSWLRVGTSTQGVRTDRGGAAASFSGAFYANPLIQPYDSTGALAVVPWPEDPATNNALEGLAVQSDDINKRLFSSNYVEAQAPFLKGLSYRLNAGFDLADRNSGTYYGRNTSTGRPLNGRGLLSNTVRSDWTLENIVRYTRAVGKHNVDFTGLLSEQSNSLETRSSRAEGFPNDVLTYRATNALLVVPNDDATDSKILSQMGRLNYGYDSRYLLTLTARRDGYSGFGANNKWGTFPSVAFAWNAANEAFFPWKDRFSQAKLRLSYGKNGNQAVPPYRTLSQLGDRPYLNGDASAPGYGPATLGNANLKWETTLSGNVGLDIGLFNDRVVANVDAYRSRTSDLLLNRAISSVQGISNVYQNIGKTQNKGVELQLATVNVDRGGFQWRTDFNISANRNEIVDLYGDATDDIANRWFIGQPVDVNYGYRFAGIWQVSDSVDGTIAKSGQPTARPGYVRIVDVNGDGKIDLADRTIIGSLQPDYQAGLTNTFRFKRLTLSGYLYTVQGVTRNNDLLGTNQVFSDVRRNTVYRQYWTPETPINTYPSNSNSSNPLSVAFYEDASFVRLRDLTLSYDLPTRLASRLSASSVKVYVNGRNLWTSTKWTGLDPEFTIAEQRTIPLERLITGGLNVRF
jgi:TonB-linked SusC/RagA family outer membrane protein